MPAAIVNGHQYVVGNELWIACDFVEGLRDTGGEIGGSKQLTPVPERPLCELRIQQRDNLVAVGEPTRGVLEARIGSRLRVTNRLQEQWELFVFIGEDEQEPAVVARAVDIGECIRRVETVWRQRRSAAREHS